MKHGVHRDRFCYVMAPPVLWYQSLYKPGLTP